jgi:hypothetical protein
LTTSGRFSGGWDSRNGLEAATTSSRQDGIEEILNLQPRGSMAKPYQVKQVRKVLVQYKLAEEAQ